MAYIDEGDGDPVLCLHGEPTWSFLYRKMLSVLVAAGARVVAPDYLGFGRSDKPTDVGWYTFDRHCESIRRLVEELDLRRLTVVVQDWGGPIGLRLAVEHPARVERLVILNTGVGGGRPPSDTWLRFRDVVRAAGVEFQPGPADPDGSRARARRRRGRRVRRALPDPGVESGRARLPRAGADGAGAPEHGAAARDPRRVASWEKPALVLFGDSDPIFRPEVAERDLAADPRRAAGGDVADAGHFVQEDAGEELAARIVEFLG